MANEKAINKQIFKKWWFWVIVVVVLGVIGMATQGDTKNTDTDKAVDTSTTKPTEDTFDKDYDSLLGTLKSKYSTLGKVMGTDDDTWKQNNQRNPQQFPYEYRDVNFDNDEFFFEVKLIKDSASLDYFKNENTCVNMTGKDANCASGVVGNDVLYLISSYADGDQQSRVNQLVEELKTTLNNR
jgi:hypothetical protein